MLATLQLQLAGIRDTYLATATLYLRATFCVLHDLIQ